MQGDFPPLDQKLKLRTDHWSEGVAAVAVQQGLQAQSFERAAEAYTAAVGGGISGDSVRRLAEGYGAACEAARVQEATIASAPAQRGEAPGTIRIKPIDPLTGAANLSSDGAMLHVRGEGWKEVKIVAISAVMVKPARERVDRTATSRRAHDPRVVLSRHSYQAGLWDAETFGRQQYAEGLRRGVEHCTPLSSVNDAAEWIERTTRENFPHAVQVIDWSHVAERLGTVAGAVLGEGSVAADAWIAKRMDRLWDGNPGAVISALKHLESKASRIAKAQVRDNVVFFQNQQARMRYDDYRAAGLPIGSGTVESAACTVVHARLKRAGPGWTRTNAQSMLAGLSALHSGRFDRVGRQPATAQPN